MKNQRLWAAFALAFIFGLCIMVIASCDDRQPQAVTYASPPAQAPVVVAQQPSPDRFWENMLLYHMLFGGNSTTVVHHYDAPRYVAPRQTVVNNTTIVNKTVVKPAPAPSAPPRSVVPSYSAPRATSYSGSYSSRPSYSVSSYSSRSSFSSFSGRR